MMDLRVGLQIEGEPIPQPRPRARARRVPCGQYRGTVYDPPGRIVEWRAHVVATLTADRLRAERRGMVLPYTWPLEAHINLEFSRPASHYRNRDPERGLVQGAPAFPSRKREGDADNLAKCIMDDLVVSGWLEDDALIVDLKITKRWAEDGQTGSAFVGLYGLGLGSGMID